jgi:tetratricopeptide (TPR) repeat protein
MGSHRPNLRVPRPGYAKLVLGLASLLVTTSFAGPLAGRRAKADAPRDLYFGEAVYYARQGDYFDAIQRLDAELGQHRALDEPELDSLYHYLNQAQFSVGDFELNYRMHLKAGRAITAVLEGAVDESIRNDAAYRLARIHFQKGQLDDALAALDRIEGKVPEAIQDDVEFLRANVYMGLERYADAANTLKRLQGAKDLTGFAAYNLGIALLEEGQRDNALAQLEKAGQINATDEAVLAIRDKSNFVVGTLLTESGKADEAARFFDRVRLEGPFSNAALLSSGWASANHENFERAVVPWTLLAQRDATDASVQEAKLALPYVYGKLERYGRAAVLYASALEAFTGELKKLDASTTSIREGKFLKALLREELKQTEDWVIRLRSLPDTPETYYLADLSASHDFQTAVQNLLDLEDLRRKLAAWQISFDAFDDMVGLRRQFYEPLLPGVDAEFRDLDSRMRLRAEQHRLLDSKLNGMLTAPRPEFLATGEERINGEQLAALAKSLEGIDSPAAEVLRQRVRRLKGVLTYTLRTEYQDRLDVFAGHLKELESAMQVLNAQYESFVRARQAAVHSYEGFDTPIARLRTRVGDALGKVNLLIARQGHLVELVAIDELVARRERLQKYQDEVRYALADSYDRATKAKAEARIETTAAEQAGAAR